MTQRNRRPTARHVAAHYGSSDHCPIHAGCRPRRRSYVPSPARRKLLSPEIFGRKPFAPDPELRYFGTGVAGWQSGPGFTGGYYGYGDQPPDILTEFERE